MTARILHRFSSWLVGALTYESGQQTADAAADATRWGWLPALSGVAVGGERAGRSHAKSAAPDDELSG